jgi:hypothetical protein
MRWIKHITVPLLVLAAAVVALATVFSDHDDDYGTVTLPAGGLVELPSGTVKVFYQEGNLPQNPIADLAAPVRFEVTPAGGGAPLAKTPTADTGNAELQTQRSADIGSPGSVADIEVPAEGTYSVTGSAGRPGQPAGAARLTFGTDPLGAVARRWKLLAGLLVAAFLVALVPIPRRRPHDEAAGPSGWSSDPTAPYARTEDRAPYAG